MLVIRNGWFSYRWTQIFNQGVTPEHAEIVMAQLDTDAKDQQFSPTPIDDICAKIRENAPRVVVSPHVETFAGILMPDEYLKKIPIPRMKSVPFLSLIAWHQAHYGWI